MFSACTQCLLATNCPAGRSEATRFGFDATFAERSGDHDGFLMSRSPTLILIVPRFPHIIKLVWRKDYFSPDAVRFILRETICFALHFNYNRNSKGSIFYHISTRNKMKDKKNEKKTANAVKKSVNNFILIIVSTAESDNMPTWKR